MHACSELDYLLIRDKGFNMFTDHRNLIYIFAPGTEIKNHIRDKLLWWSLNFSEYNYLIEHIADEDNVWADMFSRWAGKNRLQLEPARGILRRRLSFAPWLISNGQASMAFVTLNGAKWRPPLITWTTKMCTLTPVPGRGLRGS